MFICVWAAHVCVEARGRCHVPSFIALHLTFRGRVSSLLVLASEPQGFSNSMSPVLGLQVPGFYMGVGDLNSGPHAYIASTEPM